MKVPKATARRSVARAQVRANPNLPQELRDAIAMLESARKSYQRQLDGETRTLFRKDALQRRIAEIEASQQAMRETLLQLQPVNP